MKKALLYLSIIAALSASAQSKINPVGRLELAKYHDRVLARQAAQSTASQPIETPTVGAIVMLCDGYTAADLAAEGYDVTTDLGDMAVVTLPIDGVEALSELRQVKQVSFGNRRRANMCFARPDAGVDQAHAGIVVDGQDLGKFDGSGVVLGMMDEGLDPNHLNFQGRVERVWHFSSSTGVGKEYTGSTVTSFSTDNKEETHATHVAGIMGGGYRGTSTYMKAPSADPSSTASATQTTGTNPYLGVAPGAALALSCGQLYDNNIVAGVQKVIDYAKAQGKPAAINLSLGSNGGPQDGSDALCQALERMGKDAIICISAGNEGTDNISIEKTFTASETSLKTMLFYNSSYISSNYGYLDIWASDSRPLSVTISNVSSTGTTSNSFTLSTTATNKQITTGVKTGGYLYYTAGVDAANGRYNVLMDFDQCLPKTGRFSISVSGAQGQTVTMFFSGYSGFTDSYNNNATKLAGYTPGTPDNTINSMVCGDNVISVAAHTTTAAWFDFSGGPWTYNETLGDIASFSSYGHDFYGRQLPLVSAPGTVIMSSFSRPYIDGGYGDDYYESASDMVGKAVSGTSTHYWGAMQGTSMACPFATGVMALWLQADPTLTYSDMLDVMEHTSTADQYTRASARKFGYGKINAAEGLRYILAASAIGEIRSDDCDMVITRSADCCHITLAGAPSLQATLYDLQGRPIATASAPSCDLDMPLPRLAQGIYVMRVSSPAKTYTRKITL